MSIETWRFLILFLGLLIKLAADIVVKKTLKSMGLA